MAKGLTGYKLADVAYLFETLQTDRQLAVYDTITPISLGTAPAMVATARRVVAGWAATRGTDDAKVFFDGAADGWELGEE